MGKKGAQALNKNPNWKGGRTIASNGYVLVKAPDHPDADVRGYIYEHRLVAEKKLGRRLRKGEQVHHVDGNKSNNAPENIEVHASQRHHAKKHRTTNFNLRDPGEENQLINCACGCGTQFRKFDGDGRPRRYVTGHNVTRNLKGQFEAITNG